MDLKTYNQRLLAIIGTAFVIILFISGGSFLFSVLDLDFTNKSKKMME